MTSDAPPKLDAERYFAAEWLQQPKPLPRDAGTHRVVWNLRYDRPAALSFDYSIAANPGVGAPLTPGGAWAVPGDYRVVLTVDGHVLTRPVRILVDPRERLAPGDLEAQLALSKRIAEALALSRRGYLERATAHDQLEAAGRAAASRDPALKGRVEALALETGKPGVEHLKAANGALAAIETDLETADRPPTRAQTEAVDAQTRLVTAEYAAWSALRDGDLATLSVALKKAGLPPVSIPPVDVLKSRPAEDEGEDLP
jgi:hypothetical protein